MGSGNWLNKRF